MCIKGAFACVVSFHPHSHPVRNLRVENSDILEKLILPTLFSPFVVKLAFEPICVWLVKNASFPTIRYFCYWIYNKYRHPSSRERAHSLVGEVFQGCHVVSAVIELSLPSCRSIQSGADVEWENVRLHLSWICLKELIIKCSGWTTKYTKAWREHFPLGACIQI